jgi:hypothetical protein
MAVTASTRLATNSFDFYGVTEINLMHGVQREEEGEKHGI